MGRTVGRRGRQTCLKFEKFVADFRPIFYLRREWTSDEQEFQTLLNQLPKVRDTSYCRIKYNKVGPCSSNVEWLTSNSSPARR